LVEFRAENFQWPTFYSVKNASVPELLKKIGVRSWRLGMLCKKRSVFSSCIYVMLAPLWWQLS